MMTSQSFYNQCTISCLQDGSLTCVLRFIYYYLLRVLSAHINFKGTLTCVVDCILIMSYNRLHCRSVTNVLHAISGIRSCSNFVGPIYDVIRI